jgi:sigma-B regulation protein RsbU (phosphoserine phosphatase)
MLAAPIPDNDDERLAALHSLNLLDTPAEERFDRITRLLTIVLRVPMAYVSLVDADRQWFKSTCGLPSGQTTRAVSFCGHAILNDDLMVVTDAAEDARFRDNPLVTGEPFLRFYAGQPLHGPGGYRVGTLCIADRKPRGLADAEREALREMARLVERELALVEVARLQRDLIASQQQRLHELAQAAKYVRSLLPDPLDLGPVRARWRFEPSSELGGDCFGYDWIDPDHFAVYLLDVSGHGVGAALLSISVADALRSRTLPDTDMLDPAAVLGRLNDAFPMERHDEKYFTLWYGVFDRKGRTLHYASGGHPPALLVGGTSTPLELGTPNVAIGMFPGALFHSGRVDIGPKSTLYVFSDGAYEVRKPDGTVMAHAELIEFIARRAGPCGPDEVWQFVRQVGISETLADDFSLLEVVFE